MFMKIKPMLKNVSKLNKKLTMGILTRDMENYRVNGSVGKGKYS